jgi:hypothetical protein
MNFFFENKEWIFSGIGVLVISLVVSLLRYFFKKKIPSLRYFFKKKPDVNQELIPNHANIQSDFGIKRLEAKIHNLYYQQKCPFVLVGSVYLDIILRPIITTILDKREWDNLDPIRIDLGGSIVCVGRFLFLDHRQRSHIYSIKGGFGEPLSELFDVLIKKERWPENELKSGKSKSKPAVTVHLVQSDNKFSTMFTQKSDLVELGWDNVNTELKNLLEEGGVLYIGGYFKTNLCAGFADNLAKYSEKTLICIDHGSLAPELISYQSIQALCEAFRKERIDIYICTFSEIVGFFQKSTNQGNDLFTGDTQKDLNMIAQKGILPKITYVRGSDVPGSLDAYAIVNKTVLPIQKQNGQIFQDSPVAPKNAFNAAVLYSLVKGERFDNINRLAVTSGLEGLKYCHKHRNMDVSRR